MKKICLILLIFLFIVSCVQAQNTDNEKKLVGTWIDMQTDQEWIIYANKSITINNKGALYTATSGKLAIADTDSLKKDVYLLIFNYYISSDGNSLILEYSSGQTWNTVTGKSYWLKKK
jgi:thioredoxin-related protein